MPSAIPSPERLLGRYFTELRIRNWSPRTINRRSYPLHRFVAWCAERRIDTVADITRDAVECYRRSLHDYRNARTRSPLKAATQAAYLTALRHWLDWLTQEGWIADNPAEKLRMPKEEHRLPSAHLTLQEVERVLGQADLTTKLGIRDRAMLETFYSTGIRRMELIGLQTGDLDIERRLVAIRQGKNRRTRVVPVGRRAIGWIERYRREVRPELIGLIGQSTATLFLSARGRELNPNHVSALTRKYLTAAGITKRGSCHMLRHTTATLMLEGGADLRSLQTLLGHQRLSTTEIYTHVTITHLRQVHDRTHPASAPSLEAVDTGDGGPG